MSRALVCAVILAAAASSATADPGGSFTSVNINSATSVYVDPGPDSFTSNVGAPVQVSDTGSAPYAIGNGSGGYTIKPISDDVYAYSSLAAAQLKARASLSFGTDTYVSGAPMPLGHSNGNATANATFGDHFSAFTGSTPFLWSAGDQARFQFAVTGTNTSTPGLPVPTSYDPGQPIDMVSASLHFTAYTPGGLALRNELLNFDFDTRSFDEFTALSAQLDSMIIPGSNRVWYFGNSIVPYPLAPDEIVPLDPNNPTLVNLSFNPQGDFDWLLELDTDVQLDASLQNVNASLDFSHTINTLYTPPDGTTTYSSSGLFPNTLPLAPEPTSLCLFLLPLAAAARRRRD